MLTREPNSPKMSGSTTRLKTQPCSALEISLITAEVVQTGGKIQRACWIVQQQATGSKGGGKPHGCRGVLCAWPGWEHCRQSLVPGDKSCCVDVRTAAREWVPVSPLGRLGLMFPRTKGFLGAATPLCCCTAYPVHKNTHPRKS